MGLCWCYMGRYATATRSWDAGDGARRYTGGAAGAAKDYAAARDSGKRQQFESSLFNMLNLFESVVQRVKMEDDGDLYGLDAFERLAFEVRRQSKSESKRIRWRRQFRYY